MHKVFCSVQTDTPEKATVATPPWPRPGLHPVDAQHREDRAGEHERLAHKRVEGQRDQDHHDPLVDLGVVPGVVVEAPGVGQDEAHHEHRVGARQGVEHPRPVRREAGPDAQVRPVAEGADQSREGARAAHVDAVGRDAVVVAVGEVQGVVALGDAEVEQADVDAVGVHPDAGGRAADGHVGEAHVAAVPDGDARGGGRPALRGRADDDQARVEPPDVHRGLVGTVQVVDGQRGVPPREEDEGVARAALRQGGLELAVGVQPGPRLPVGVGAGVDEPHVPPRDERGVHDRRGLGQAALRRMAPPGLGAVVGEAPRDSGVAGGQRAVGQGPGRVPEEGEGVAGVRGRAPRRAGLGDEGALPLELAGDEVHRDAALHRRGDHPEAGLLPAHRDGAGEGLRHRRPAVREVQDGGVELPPPDGLDAERPAVRHGPAALLPPARGEQRRQVQLQQRQQEVDVDEAVLGLGDRHGNGRDGPGRGAGRRRRDAVRPRGAGVGAGGAAGGRGLPVRGALAFDQQREEAGDVQVDGAGGLDARGRDALAGEVHVGRHERLVQHAVALRDLRAPEERAQVRVGLEQRHVQQLEGEPGQVLDRRQDHQAVHFGEAVPGGRGVEQGLEPGDVVAQREHAALHGVRDRRQVVPQHVAVPVARQGPERVRVPRHVRAPGAAEERAEGVGGDGGGGGARQEAPDLPGAADGVERDDQEQPQGRHDEAVEEDDQGVLHRALPQGGAGGHGPVPDRQQHDVRQEGALEGLDPGQVPHPGRHRVVEQAGVRVGVLEEVRVQPPAQGLLFAHLRGDPRRRALFTLAHGLLQGLGEREPTATMRLQCNRCCGPPAPVLLQYNGVLCGPQAIILLQFTTHPTSRHPVPISKPAGPRMLRRRRARPRRALRGEAAPAQAHGPGDCVGVPPGQFNARQAEAVRVRRRQRVLHVHHFGEEGEVVHVDEGGLALLAAEVAPDASGDGQGPDRAEDEVEHRRGLEVQNAGDVGRADDVGPRQPLLDGAELRQVRAGADHALRVAAAEGAALPRPSAEGALGGVPAVEELALVRARPPAGVPAPRPVQAVPPHRDVVHEQRLRAVGPHRRLDLLPPPAPRPPVHLHAQHRAHPRDVRPQPPVRMQEGARLPVVEGYRDLHQHHQRLGVPLFRQQGAQRPGDNDGTAAHFQRHIRHLRHLHQVPCQRLLPSGSGTGVLGVARRGPRGCRGRWLRGSI